MLKDITSLYLKIKFVFNKDTLIKDISGAVAILGLLQKFPDNLKVKNLS